MQPSVATRSQMFSIDGAAVIIDFVDHVVRFDDEMGTWDDVCRREAMVRILWPEEPPAWDSMPFSPPVAAVLELVTEEWGTESEEVLDRPADEDGPVSIRVGSTDLLVLRAVGAF